MGSHIFSIACNFSLIFVLDRAGRVRWLGLTLGCFFFDDLDLAMYSCECFQAF